MTTTNDEDNNDMNDDRDDIAPLEAPKEQMTMVMMMIAA